VGPAVQFGGGGGGGGATPKYTSCVGLGAFLVGICWARRWPVRVSDSPVGSK
jgi:hypothetical protein